MRLQESDGCDKAKDCRRTYVVPDDLEKCKSSQQNTSKTIFLEKLKSMESLFQSPKTSLLSCEAPSGDSGTENLPCLAEWIPSLQDTLDLNVKPIKQKANRMTYEVGKTNDYCEEIVESSEGSMKDSWAKTGKLECQTKKRRKHKSRAGRESNASPHRNEDGGLRADANEDAKKNKNSTGNTKASRKTYVISLSDLSESPPSIQPGLRSNENMPPGAICKNRSRIPKAQRASTSQNSQSLNKNTISSSLMKASERDQSNANGVKKRVKSKSKTIRKMSVLETQNVERDSVASEIIPETSAEAESRQSEQGEQNFLHVTIFKTEPDSFLMEEIRTPAMVSPVVGSPGLSDFSVISHSEALPSSPLGLRLKSYPCQMLPTAEDHQIPEQSCDLPKSFSIFKENDAEQMPRGKCERKKVEASCKVPSQSSAMQENENKTLKDLTNTSLTSYNFSPKSTEEPTARPARRRQDPACYVEPKLNRKLRRGDPHTNEDFLHSPVYKTKRKKVAKGNEKSKRIKQEENDLQVK
uniref:Shugoshin C-terminal domain-containing protein n=1 Tax=Sphenodon punctatus TaxID=8508 RepID=A0A8D0GIB4_SPHPU